MRKEGEGRRQGETKAIWNCGEVTRGLLKRGRDTKRSKDMCLERKSQVSHMHLHHALYKQANETIHDDS